MSDIQLSDLTLPNGVVIPGTSVRRFLWGGTDRGIRWLEALPDLLAEWCAREGVTLLPELPTLSMNLVLFGNSEKHGPVVIKTSPPHDEVRAEIDALRAHASPHIVRLIDADPDVAIMTLARITPGYTMRSRVEAGELSEREAAVVAARLMREFWSAPESGATAFRLRYWFRGLFEYRDRYPHGGGRIPHRHVELACRAAERLLESERELVPVHGDLHHDNILWDRDNGWTIIDPKGLVGERGYDIANWTLNPVGVDRRGDIATLTNDRLDWFSELLNIDRYRLWQWAMAHAVLSDCWNLQGDENAYLHGQAIAEALSRMPEALKD